MEELIDQLQQLTAALSATSPPVALAAVVVIGIITKAMFSLKRALDFHDEYFVKKRIKRLTELKALVNEGQPLSRFLDQSLETEAFRVDSGITASPLKMHALIEIHDSGLWTVPQLRGAARHLVIDIDTQKASIEITTADRVAAQASVGFSIFLLMMGAVYFASLAITKSIIGFVAGVLIFGGFVIVARLMTYDYRSYRMALQVEDYLKNKPDAAEPSRPAPLSPPAELN